MTKSRRIETISGVRDKAFIPYETRRRIPWPVYSVLIALAAWGVFTLLGVDAYTPDAQPATSAASATNDKPTTGKSADSQAASAGHRLFNQFCATCHQQEGIGLTGAVPPLAGSSMVTGEPRVPIGIVLMGVAGELTVDGTVFNGRMPTFREALTDREIAAIVTYVRQAWTNEAGPVSAAQVASLRAELAGQPAPLAEDQGVQRLTKPGTPGDPANDPVKDGDGASTAETMR